MPTLFTRIIDGELPGRIVWSDDKCAAFLTLEPLRLGHVLVVPREEVDQWVDLEPSLAAHVFNVAATIGRSQRTAFRANRVGLLLQGYEVPHAHVHVWPSQNPGDFELRNVMRDVADDVQDSAAETLRAQLRADGHAEHVPEQ